MYNNTTVGLTPAQLTEEYQELCDYSNYDEHAYGDTDFHTPTFVPDTLDEYIELRITGNYHIWKETQTYYHWAHKDTDIIYNCTTLDEYLKHVLAD